MVTVKQVPTASDAQLLSRLSALSKTSSAASTQDDAHSRMLKSLSVIAGKPRERARRRVLRDERLVSTSKSSNNLTSTTLSGFGSITIDDLIRAGTAADASKTGQPNVSKPPKQHQQLKQQVHLYKRQEESNAPLPTALEQKEQQAVRRQVAYENARKEGNYWVPFIKRNRAAPNIQFPLGQARLDIVSTAKDAAEDATKLAARKPWNELEQQVMSALSDSADNVLTSTSNLTRAERRTLHALSLHEAQERRRELRRHRALLSAREDKARRVRKIKSKRYHRLLKKDRVKSMLAEFERMRQENPEAALEKLRQLEEARIQERMSLKHRNTSKWAKQQLVRSKYDRDARATLREQLELSRDLTHKADNHENGAAEGPERHDAEHHNDNFGDESDNADEMNYRSVLEKRFEREATENPWMDAGGRVKTQHNNDRTEQHVGGQTAVDDDDDTDENDDSDEDDELDAQTELDKTFARLKQTVSTDIDGVAQQGNISLKKRGTHTGPSPNAVQSNDDADSLPNIVDDTGGEIMASDLFVPSLPDNALRPSRKVKKAAERIEPLTPRPPIVSDLTGKNDLQSDDDDDDAVADDDNTNGGNSHDQEKIRLIAEAFAEDDVYEEFRTEKLRDEQSKKERLERQLFGDKATQQHDLPGWGEWSGPGAPPEPKRKRRQRRMRRLRMTDGIMRVLAEERKQLVRLGAGNVGENENVKFDMEAIRDKAPIRALQVSELPYPFASVAQYEAVMSDSVGRDWNPETVVAQLTMPRVEIQRGAIIEPVSHRIAAGLVKPRRRNNAQESDDDEEAVGGGDFEQNISKTCDIEIKSTADSGGYMKRARFMGDTNKKTRDGDKTTKKVAKGKQNNQLDSSGKRRFMNRNGVGKSAKVSSTKNRTRMSVKENKRKAKR